LNESLLGSDRRVDPIVLQSEWWFNDKHFFVREPYEIDRRIIVPFQQLFAASQTGDAVGFRQLLRTMSSILPTFQPLSGNLFNRFRAPNPSTDKDF